jgi:hypothetical protein
VTARPDQVLVAGAVLGGAVWQLMLALPCLRVPITDESVQMHTDAAFVLRPLFCGFCLGLHTDTRVYNKLRWSPTTVEAVAGRG